MELTFKVNKTPNHIFEYLSDMQKFASVHPVISKITRKKEGHYMIYETLKLGFIPFSFSYPATVERIPKSNAVIMRATVMKIIKISMIFKIHADQNSSIIKEQISFKSILPVKLIMSKVFRKQHSALFQNINELK